MAPWVVRGWEGVLCRITESSNSRCCEWCAEEWDFVVPLLCGGSHDMS